MAADAESVSELLSHWASEKGDAQLFAWWEDKKAKVTVTKTLTYADVERSAASTAWRLCNKEGVKAGDRCLLVYEPGLAFVCAFLACGRAAAVAVPVFPPEPRRRATAELSAFVEITRSCAATFALTSTTYGWARKVSALSALLPGGDAAWPAGLKWIVADVGETAGGLVPDAPPGGPHAEVAFLQYTSGSTSAPKGVVITHASLTHNLDLIVSDLKADEATVCVSWLPQYHDMGLIGSYLGTLRCGGKGFYASPFAFVKRPACWLEAVAQFRGTHLQAPNFAYALATRKPPSATLDLSSVRHAINAAEPVDAATIDAFEKMFCGTHGLPKGVVFPTYGLAESTVLVCGNGVARATVDADALRDERVVKEGGGAAFVGCGAPRSDRGVSVAIVDRGDDDEASVKRCAAGAVGEIWVKSPSVAAGYWGRADGDFGAVLDGEGGYLRTGDEGFLLRGELFVCGRRKDLIILRGKNHYPQDVERAIEKAAPRTVRPGCVAAVAGDDCVAVVAEVRDDAATRKARAASAEPAGLDDAKGGYAALCAGVAAAVAEETGASVGSIALLPPRTIAKTTSGKIARRRVAAARAAGTLAACYEWTSDGGAAPDETARLVTTQPGGGDSAAARGGVVADLAAALGRAARRPADSFAATAPLVDVGVDSMTLAQFRGVLEGEFGVTDLPDDFLFRDDTTLLGLACIVEGGGAFDEVAYRRALRDLEVAAASGSKKKKGDFMVDNCVCCLVCCPGKLRK